MLGLLGCAAAFAVAGVSDAMPTVDMSPTPRADGQSTLPSSPSATELRNVTAEDAVALNARIPLSALPTSAAPAFRMGNAKRATQAEALECLTNAIYYEAGRETTDGQRAVAQVILNRVRHPAYPSSVCGVVFQGSTRVTGCQFTFTCDGSMANIPMTSEWQRARKVAWSALNGAVFAPVGLATHYHANYVLPYWASSLVKTHIEGAHLFYRWSGNWGRPSAFSQRYAAREAKARELRSAALAVEHLLPPAIVPATQTAAAEALEKVDGVVVADAGKRVSAHFTPQAREAVERAKVTPYVERVDASENLRRALDGGATSGSVATPFGQQQPASAPRPAPVARAQPVPGPAPVARPVTVARPAPVAR